MQGRLIAFAVLLTGLVQAAETRPTEPLVTLSPYEVRANSVEFKHWIKVGSPNFILYTDGSSAEASRALREFEMLRFASQVVFGRKVSRFGPVVLVLPTASSDWRKLQSKGDMEWKATATGLGHGIVDGVVVQYDWEEQGLAMARAILGFSEAERMEIWGPFWFGRGLGALYEASEFDGDRVVLGRVNPRIWELHGESWLPWGRFFEVTAHSPEFLKEAKVGVFEAQASLFTHFLFTNPDRSWMGRLVTWVDYLKSGGAPTEAKFKEIFGQDWKTWQRTMEAYLNGGQYSVFQVKTPTTVTHFTETKYKLPVKEMRELFILTQILVQKTPESEASLDALLAKGLESEPLRELLVDACLEWKRRDAALQNVERLIAAGSTNARVYRMGDGLRTAYAGPFSLDCRYGSELAQVRAWDHRGQQLEPLYSDLNESVAVNEACAAVVDQQSVLTIETCYSRVKDRNPAARDRVIAALAMALWRTGDTQTAQELATRLAGDSEVPERTRAMAADLVGRIKAGIRPAGATP